MGIRLADEVKRWIKDWCPKDNFAKISFIGHSLGGLLIRAALPHLDKYKDKMQTILTLATPHLGFMLSTSKVVDTGLWVMKKWKKCICLN
jgi:triacylglycerol esterase/lipase EstA (alpha/beta hydrolase family)